MTREPTWFEKYILVADENTELRAEIERLRDLLAYNGIDPDAVVENAKGACRTYKALMGEPKP